MKIALDVLSDYSHRELYSFLDVNTIPDFVKQAEVITKEAADKLSEDGFADRYHRAFPIDSPANVYVSNAYFINKKAELEKIWGKKYVTEVESRIDKSAELFEIEENIKAYNNDLTVKTAADYTEKCVSSIQSGQGTYELFPYKTAADIEKQAQFFANDIKNYPFQWRCQIASDFVKAAIENSAEELPELVCKYAGYYFPDTRNIATELTRRMNKISNEKAKQEYKTLIEKASSVSSRESALELCGEAYNTEKRAGCYENNALSSTLGDIVDKTFTLSFEKVAELLNVVNMDGEPYSVNDLKKVSKDIYKQAFGCDIDPASDSDLYDILPTMPKSDVALFRELSGVNSL